MPKRIQRRRVPGWRMPEGVVYVGRPTKWGNPFSKRDAPASRPDAQQWAVDAFRAWVGANAPFCDEVRVELAGKDLACWCRTDQPCHADVLLGLAADESGRRRALLGRKTYEWVTEDLGREPTDEEVEIILATRRGVAGSDSN